MIIRRSGQGWRVGDEDVPDLTSAMVLAELLAPGFQPPGSPVPAGTANPAGTASPAGIVGPSGITSAADITSAAGMAGPADGSGDVTLADEAARLRVTVAQLQHALATRVRVEQAIGVLSERRRIPPRQAFDLLRSVARGSGLRVADLAGQVVDSAVNPLLILPGDLARPPREQPVRGRSPRHMRVAE